MSESPVKLASTAEAVANGQETVEKVAEHYNSKNKIDLRARSESRIFYMRNFNNWVKSVLISEFVKILKSANGGKLKILDLGCGRGGDMRKWIKAENVEHVTFADLADKSLDECHDRYKEMRPRFEAKFVQLDATRDLLSDKMEKSIKHDLVSSQFVIHYSFESIGQACRFLENVSENLKPGGYFIGTTTNGHELIRRLRAAESNSFGNEIYEIRFYQEQKDHFDLFGVKFDFRLDGVVECPEFLLNFSLLEKLARRYGLKLVYKKPFNEFFYEYYQNPDYSSLLSIMQALEPYTNHVKNTKSASEYEQVEAKLKEEKEKREEEEKNVGSSENWATLSKSEWEAITLYLVYAFVKEDEQPSATKQDLDDKQSNEEG